MATKATKAMLREIGKSRTGKVTRCFMCDGTGKRCNRCGETELICTCVEDGKLEYSNIVNCEDCNGTGE